MSLREGPLNELRPSRGWLAAAAVAAAALIAAAIFFSARKGPSAAPSPWRSRFDSVIGPVEEVVSAPAHWVRLGAGAVGDYILAGSQNAALRARLVQARADEDQLAALRDENARLRALLGLRTDPPLPLVSARTVIDARGPFAHTRLADVGSALGVEEGNPVLSDHGLVGRIAGVAPQMSRILLLTDPVSRVPVIVAGADARAILAGDGSDAPRLDYAHGAAPLRSGERVYTSGDGGVIPRGLPVGATVKALDGWRVALDSDAAPIDFVRILLFHDFSQVAGGEPPAPSSAPSLRTAPPTQAPTAAVQGPASAAAPSPSPANGRAPARPRLPAPQLHGAPR